MFMSVDFPAPFSPRSACTSPWRRSKSTRSLASTPGKRLVIPRSSSRGASAIARAILSRRPPPARELLRGGARANACGRGDTRIQRADADRTARGGELEVLAAVIDAVDSVAHDLSAVDVRELEVRPRQPPPVPLVRAGDRGLGADPAVGH